MSKHTKLILAIVVAFAVFAAVKTYGSSGTAFITCNEESLSLRMPEPQAWVSLKWADIARACRESK